jgi:hypothetical protein
MMNSPNLALSLKIESLKIGRKRHLFQRLSQKIIVAYGEVPFTGTPLYCVINLIVHVHLLNSFFKSLLLNISLGFLSMA